MILRGHSVVEIGTRRGDGIQCFAKFATATTAIEMDTNYCAFLEKRGIRTVCKAFQQVYIDADFYTWWAETRWKEAPFQNVDALLHLRKGQKLGKVRENATALVLAASGEWEEKRKLKGIDAFVLSATPTPFQEKPSEQPETFPRKGVFHILAIPIKNVNIEKVEEWEGFVEF